MVRVVAQKKQEKKEAKSARQLLKAQIPADKTGPQEFYRNTIPGCQHLIAIWAVGFNGVCYHNNAGFRVGINGYKKVMIEMHWNNPLLVNTYTDASGMTLYLTPNLRPYDAGMMLIGQVEG